MTRIEFWEPSGETEIPGKGTVRDQYAPHAFDNAVGRRVPFRLEPGGPQIGWGTVISVRVDDDGLGATWEIDADLPVPDLEQVSRAASFSFRLPELTPELHDPLAAAPPVIRPRPD